MLKRLTVAVAALFVLATSAFAAGTVPGFALTPQFDKLGKLATGCKLYVVQAGTVAAPQNAYQDTALTILQPNPMTCDATGRLPQWFVADGNIKLRLTDKNGIDLFVQDNLLVIGPVWWRWRWRRNSRSHHDPCHGRFQGRLQYRRSIRVRAL
jgi:hypothetical protein